MTTIPPLGLMVMNDEACKVPVTGDWVTVASLSSLTLKVQVQNASFSISNWPGVFPLPGPQVDALQDIRQLTAQDEITARSANHDQLNANANLQIGDEDVGPDNLVPVHIGSSAQLTADANLQIGDEDVGPTNPVPVQDVNHVYSLPDMVVAGENSQKIIDASDPAVARHVSIQIAPEAQSGAVHYNFDEDATLAKPYLTHGAGAQFITSQEIHVIRSADATEDLQILVHISTPHGAGS